MAVDTFLCPLQPSCDTSLPANVFGVELHQLVEKEGSAVPIPLLIQKCVAEIECRGLKVRLYLSPAGQSVCYRGVIGVLYGRWLDCTDYVALLLSRRSSGIGSRGTAQLSASARTSTPISTSLQVSTYRGSPLHSGSRCKVCFRYTHHLLSTAFFHYMYTLTLIFLLKKKLLTCKPPAVKF